VDLPVTSNNYNILFSERLDAELDSRNSEDMKTGIKTGFIIVVGFAEVNTVRLGRRRFSCILIPVPRVILRT